LAVFDSISNALTQLHDATFERPRFDPATATLTLKLGLSDDNEILFLPTIAARIAEQAPQVSIVTRPVSHTDVSSLLDRGEIDLGVSVFADVPKWQRKETLFTQRYGCLFDPRRIKRRAPLSLHDFVASKQMIVSFNSELRGQATTCSPGNACSARSSWGRRGLPHFHSFCSKTMRSRRCRN